VKPIRPITRPLKALTDRAPKPFLSLCVIFRDNQDTIRPLLESVVDHFDEFVFTDTGCKDDTRKILESFGELVRERGKAFALTDFAWCDDFAKARNANFKAATGKWRFFLDTDDVLVGGHNLRSLIEKTEKEHPYVEGLFISYDYDVLEELPTLRLLKWGSHWNWTDAIHERLVSNKPLPNNALANIENKDTLCVKHRRKSEEDKDRALRRNAVIARRDYETTTDKDYKARLARTIAMELKLDGKLAECRPYLKEVGATYPTLPEGRHAYSDLSRLEANDGNLHSALKYAKLAGPAYEAIVYHAMGEWVKCIEAATKSSVAGQQTTHEGFLFEKVFAPICMADAAAHLDYPAGGVEKVINSVRGDLRTHKAVGDAVMSIRKHIDRITILVPQTPQPFDWSSTNTMLGGSEEAVVYLTRALAQLGRNVRVYGILPPTSLGGIDPWGVEWRDFKDFDVDDEHGVLVIWRATGLVKHLIETQIRRLKAKKEGDEAAFAPAGIGNSSFWLHDMSIGVADPRTANAILKGVSSVIVLSDHHQKCIERSLPSEHNVKFVKLANGIVGKDFGFGEAADPTPLMASLPKKANKIVYTSCPSRGLRTLLWAWPKVKQACPDAYLDIYYDWSMLQRFQPAVYQDVMSRYEAVRHLDVHHHGGVGHQELYEAMSDANVWAYSHYESTDVETFCISAVKATAIGCHVLTAPNGALPEVAPDATFVPEAVNYADALIAAIQNPMSSEDRLRLAKDAVAKFDWLEVAKRFSEVWTVLPKKPTGA
jgi:glycosyltransferase involved in cell wall biosynthesis